MKTKLGTNKSKERKKLIKKCDKLVSLIVRKRDKRCVVCGSINNLQCSHLIKRGRMATRFDMRNCNTNCSKHNFSHNYNPEIYTCWFVGKYGVELYRELIDLATKGRKWELEELIVLKKHLEQKLKEVENETALSKTVRVL